MPAATAILSCRPPHADALKSLVAAESLLGPSALALLAEPRADLAGALFPSQRGATRAAPPSAAAPSASGSRPLGGAAADEAEGAEPGAKPKSKPKWLKM